MRYDTGVSQRWSNNFYIDHPRQVSEKSLYLKGRARALEGVFNVEVRKDGEVLARQSLKAKEGGDVVELIAPIYEGK